MTDIRDLQNPEERLEDLKDAVRALTTALGLLTDLMDSDIVSFDTVDDGIMRELDILMLACRSAVHKSRSENPDIFRGVEGLGEKVQLN
jgi:hypothetical protein